MTLGQTDESAVKQPVHETNKNAVIARQTSIKGTRALVGRDNEEQPQRGLFLVSPLAATIPSLLSPPN